MSIETATMQQVGHAVAELAKFNATFAEMKTMMGEGIKTSQLRSLWGIPTKNRSRQQGPQHLPGHYSQSVPRPANLDGSDPEAV